LQPSADPVLCELLAALNSRPELRAGLIGHTDAVGAPAHNQDLSARRAATVLTWLVQHGIAAGRLQSSGVGAAQPIADNNAEPGRALNRRVEVKALN
jgi:OOP family OmpA-OmpF porin